MVRERVIRAVHENDLVRFLDSFGLLEDAIEGRLICYICGKPAKLKEISKMIIFEDELKVICNKNSCSEMERVFQNAD